jgi:hypothetical protein
MEPAITASVTGQVDLTRHAFRDLGWFTGSAITSVPEGPGPDLRLASAPNPFDGATTVSFRLSRPGPVELDVYGVDGRHVRAGSSALPAGVHFTWNGLDDDGRAAPAGVYLIRLHSRTGSSGASHASDRGAKSTKVVIYFDRHCSLGISVPPLPRGSSLSSPTLPPAARAVFAWLFPALILAAHPSWAGPETTGQWSPVYSWPQVAIHMSLMPDGRVVSFADDDNPNYNVNGTRLAGSTKTYIVEIPAGGVPGPVTFIPNDRTNMFCSGHSFLADGRLFVIGGHLGKDGWGEPRTEFFDYRDPTVWYPGPDMFQGRWYPSACVLGNGDLLAVSGSRDSTVINSSTPEVWSPNSGWRQLTGAVRSIPYYPFAILAPDGRVFTAGPHVDTRFLTVTGSGSWSTARNHVLNVERSYGSAVQYADGKVLVAGGADPPTNTCEIIDLNAGTPTWLTTRPMNFARRQGTLTMLPDGTVLATGGTSGAGFNNNTGAVLTPEIWTPPPDSMWRPMANMAIPRLYHSTTVLLPDGRVLSAGSGRPKASNGGADQLNCEIFSPPYLFKGARPSMTSAPSIAHYGEAFVINTPNAASIW